MTTYVHGKNAALIHGSIDLSPWVRDAKAEAKIDTGDTSHFGSNAKTYLLGQNDGTFSFSGMYDGNKLVQQGVTGINEYMAGVIASEQAGGTPVPVLLAPYGIGIGNSAIGGLAKQTSYGISLVISDIEQITADIQLTNGFVAGSFLSSLNPISASTNFASVDDVASSPLGAFLTLHILSNGSSGSGTYKIQHSTDNTVWVDLYTFTAVPATTLTAQSATVTGTVNRYVRLAATLSGTGAVSVTASLSRN